MKILLEAVWAVVQEILSVGSDISTIADHLNKESGESETKAGSGSEKKTRRPGKTRTRRARRSLVRKLGLLFICIFAVIILTAAVALYHRLTLKVVSVTIIEESVEILKGDETVLSAVVLYSDDSTDGSVTWTSDDEDIVTVDGDGKVSAVGRGNAVVTAYAERNGSSAYAECSVTVNGSPEGYSISISTSSAALYEIFYVWVDANEEVTGIQIVAESPSGKIYTLQKSWDDAYDIYAETGLWKIHAVVSNEYGSYEGTDEYVTIDIY